MFNFDSEKFFKSNSGNIPIDTNIDTAMKYANIKYSDGEYHKPTIDDMEKEILKSKDDSKKYYDYIDSQLKESGFVPDLINLEQVKILLSTGGKANKHLGYDSVCDISQECLEIIKTFESFDNETTEKLYNKAKSIAYGRKRLAPVDIMYGLVTHSFHIIVDNCTESSKFSWRNSTQKTNDNPLHEADMETLRVLSVATIYIFFVVILPSFLWSLITN